MSVFSSDPCKDVHLDSSTVRNSLVRVDRLVRLLPVEEDLQQLDNLRNRRQTANKDNIVDRTLVKLSVLHDALDKRDRLLEQVDA